MECENAFTAVALVTKAAVGRRRRGGESRRNGSTRTHIFHVPCYKTIWAEFELEPLLVFVSFNFWIR